VAFEVRPGDLAPFLELVRANAAASLTREPECLRFDVLVPLNRGPCDVLLYEIYCDRTAFAAHLVSSHFLEFDAATREMVIKKTIADYTTRETVARI
jgi:quinol monooxygenase YgiN